MNWVWKNHLWGLPSSLALEVRCDRSEFQNAVSCNNMHGESLIMIQSIALEGNGCMDTNLLQPYWNPGSDPSTTCSWKKKGMCSILLLLKCSFGVAKSHLSPWCMSTLMPRGEILLSSTKISLATFCKTIITRYFASLLCFQTSHCLGNRTGLLTHFSWGNWLLNSRSHW